MHSDEGTIHAWLDGELSAADGARLEAHLATCAACAALVAEARGLVAASHRIVGALDDVPAGVTPAIVRAPQAAPPMVPTVRTRPWWRHPQVAAAAAVLMVAVGTWGVMREADPNAPVPMSDAMSREAVPQDNVTPPAPAPAAVAEARRPATPEASGRAASGPPPARAADPVAATEAKKAVADLAADAARKVDAAPPPPPPTDVRARNEIVQRSAAPAPAARLADSVVAQERDRLAGELRMQAGAARSAGAAPPASAPSREASASESALMTPRCFTLRRGPAALSAGVPATVELVGPMVATVPGRPPVGRVRSSAGEEWRWSAAADGSLTLLRLDGTRVAFEVPLRLEGEGEVVGVARPCESR